MKSVPYTPKPTPLSSPALSPFSRAFPVRSAPPHNQNSRLSASKLSTMSESPRLLPAVTRQSSNSPITPFNPSTFTSTRLAAAPTPPSCPLPGLTSVVMSSRTGKPSAVPLKASTPSETSRRIPRAVSLMSCTPCARSALQSLSI